MVGTRYNGIMSLMVILITEYRLAPSRPAGHTLWGRGRRLNS